MTVANNEVVNPVPVVESLFDRFVASLRNHVSKLFGQGLAAAGYYVILTHTDLTKLWAVVGAGVTVGVGYVLNQLKSKVHL